MTSKTKRIMQYALIPIILLLPAVLLRVAAELINSHTYVGLGFLALIVIGCGVGAGLLIDYFNSNKKD